MDITLRGLENAPDSSTLENGALLTAHGTVTDNGTLRPAPSPAEYWRDHGMQHVYAIHRPEGKRYLIGLDRDGNLAAQRIYDDRVNVSPNVITLKDQFAGNYDIREITPMGNTLIISTDQGICYAVYNDGSYRWLGSLPVDDTIGSFYLKGDLRMSKGDLTNIANSDNKLNVPYTAWEYVTDLNLDKEFSDQGEKDRRDQAQRRLGDSVFALINKLIGDAHADNKFVLPFFVRYAYRLADGTHIGHSAPIWMFPSDGEILAWIDTLPKTDTDANGWKVWAYWDKGYYRTMVNACTLFASMSIPTSIAKWKDFITAVDIYVSAPFYRFNQGGKIYGWGHRPVQNYDETTELYSDLLPNFGTCVPERSSGYTSAVGAAGYYDHTDISMIGLYIAGTYGTDDYNSSEEYGQPYRVSPNGIGVGPAFRAPRDFFKVEMKTAELWRDELQASGLCYKAASIKFEEFTKWTVVNGYYTKEDFEVDLPENFLDSIQARETLDDDYHTHNAITAGMTYAYDSRLWAGNVTEKLYGGTASRDTIRGGLQYHIWTAWTFLRKDSSTKVVKAQSKGNTADTIRALFYPDSNAYRMILWDGSTGEYGWYDVDLTECDILNGAAWHSNFQLQDTLPRYDIDSIPDANKYPTDSNGQLDDQHGYDYGKINSYLTQLLDSQLSDTVNYTSKVYGSRVSNPFKFDSTNINTIGNGTIHALATTTEALSQGQFGQYPLYAFTSEGIWALGISDKGSVASVTPVSRDVSTGGRVVSAANSILFATERGIMSLISNSVSPMSAALESAGTVHLTAVSDELQPVIIDNSTLIPSSLAYDYANQRLLCISATGQSRYLIASLSLITKRWSTFDIPAEHDSATGTDVPPTILNDYPDCYIYNGTAIYDISRPIVSASEINIITQPLHLSSGLYDLATLNELVVRGRLRRDNGVRVILYASKDGFTFVPIVASDRHFITRLRGSGYRYYIAQIAGTLQADESISAITVEATAKRTNKRHY